MCLVSFTSAVPGAAGFSALRVLLHEELFFRDGADFLDDVSKLLDVFRRQGPRDMI